MARSASASCDCRDTITITDPREQLVRLVDAKTFADKGGIEVEGLPFNIVAVGGSGLSH